MYKFICVLIGIYNFLVLLKVWTLASHYFFKPVGRGAFSIGLIFLIALVIFFIVHSIKFIMLYETNRKIQILLSAIDPFLRIFILAMFYITKGKPLSFTPIEIYGFILVFCFIALDIGVIIFLYLKNTRRKFEEAEKLRHEKFIKGLLQKPIK